MTKYCKVKKFMRETGAGKDQARSYLAFCSWDYKKAVVLYENVCKMLDDIGKAAKCAQDALREIGEAICGAFEGLYEMCESVFQDLEKEGDEK